MAAGNVETSQRIADVLLGALAQAAPDRVPAASQGTMNNVLIGSGGTVYYETIAGGEGGTPHRPGQSGIHTGMTNTKNTPIESLETHYPFRVAALRPAAAAAAGRAVHPGGEGMVREIEFLHPATVSLDGRAATPSPLGPGRAAVRAPPGRTGWIRRDGAGSASPARSPSRPRRAIVSGCSPRAGAAGGRRRHRGGEIGSASGTVLRVRWDDCGEPIHLPTVFRPELLTF